MGAPHNKARYGETWDQAHIDRCFVLLDCIKDHVVISGGWAWHFMSPPGHEELKHAHDHKDIDLFVSPLNVATVVSQLKSLLFEPVWTKYDRLQSKEDFRRYERVWPIQDGEKTKRITIDFFVRDVPSLEMPEGFKVVPPATLLTFYSNIHTSDKCFAVKAATRLISQGVNPVGHPELVRIPQG